MKSLQKDKKRENVFIFIGGQNILSGVYESHNIYFLNNLYKYNILNNYDVILTIIVDYERLELKETELVNDKLKKLQKIADEYNFNLEIIDIKNRSLSSLISVSKKIIKKVKCYKKKIIWSHNLFNGLLGYLLSKKIPHTYWHLDMKGVPAEEQFYKNMSLAKKILNYLVLKIIQQYITGKADSISVVSTRFKKYLAECYGYKKKIIVYPSVYKKDTFYFDKNMRDYYRSELGIKEHEKLIFYSGNLQKWQQPDFIFRLFKNIERTDRISKYKFLFLCLEVENAKSLAKTHNMDNMIITSALGKELVGYPCYVF
jgi:lysozyme family protein